jgi:hypothetical protein
MTPIHTPLIDNAVAEVRYESNRPIIAARESMAATTIGDVTVPEFSWQSPPASETVSAPPATSDTVTASGAGGAVQRAASNRIWVLARRFAGEVLSREHEARLAIAEAVLEQAAPRVSKLETAQLAVLEAKLAEIQSVIDEDQ